MTTEREYQEGQRRIKKQRKQTKKNNNPFLWIFMGLCVFIGLIMVQINQNRSPQTVPSNTNQISQ
ncbi:hypothetical protein [Crocosphaera chwakensis]|uniref:Uncharacterized protein n=1 Tax=Crocosphaera chwakensis CCY0110 TaxID=391612 RepID=A3IW62_9CHRO|nr:hypothetical protein [Crocosphaera chwakensis]EAZ89297.1 hypothetical protein CY0110_08881 [Crocosphaera chwakensis CCY0110]